MASAAQISRISLLQATSGPLSAVWRGQEFARQSAPVLSTGHAQLDAQLPGGGWPLDGMVELLQAAGEPPFWQLVMPGLAQAVSASTGPVVLVASPHAPFTPALHAQGVPASRLLCVRADRPSARLWAAEQALRCADVAAVLAWLPQSRDAELRRLQIAAQDQQRLLFVFRGAGEAQGGSPARLRLLLEAQDDMLQVHVIKRRGPPLYEPVAVPARSAALQALLDARRQLLSPPRVAPLVASVRRPDEHQHALDRAAPAR